MNPEIAIVGAGLADALLQAQRKPAAPAR